MTNIAPALNSLLADYSVFYQKLRNYHWNVKGPLFFNLHAKFEELYLDAAEKVDGVAERILALGERPHSTMAEFLAAAGLKEDAGSPDANSMVRNLVADMEALREQAGSVFDQADEAKDTTTANLMDDIRDKLAEDRWMLSAFLG